MSGIENIQDAELAIKSLAKDGERLERYQKDIDAYNVAQRQFVTRAKEYKDETNGGDLLKAGSPLTDRKIELYYDIKGLGEDALFGSDACWEFRKECQVNWGSTPPVDPRSKKKRPPNMVDFDSEGIMRGVLLQGFTDAVKSVGPNATAKAIKTQAVANIEEKDLQKLWTKFSHHRFIAIEGSDKTKKVATNSAKERLLGESGQPKLWNQMLNVMVKQDIITRKNTKPTGKGEASKGASWVYNIA
jgi:hypothetical protein|tara:strand:+ start:1258 stop:1992 length:735 start_codon:yes stop_codon:yes gene_type:complete